MVTYFGDNIVKCSLCHKEIKGRSEIHQEQAHFILVCSECCILFTNEEIQIALKLFLAYGGYFGKLISPNLSVDETLRDILIEFKSKDKKVRLEDVEEFNLALLHRALLYGITIQEYTQALEILSQ